eukprot:300221-Pyramimonas_sp.AAC.2
MQAALVLLPQSTGSKWIECHPNRVAHIEQGKGGGSPSSGALVSLTPTSFRGSPLLCSSLVVLPSVHPDVQAHASHIDVRERRRSLFFGFCDFSCASPVEFLFYMVLSPHGSAELTTSTNRTDTPPVNTASRGLVSTVLPKPQANLPSSPS